MIEVRLPISSPEKSHLLLIPSSLANLGIGKRSKLLLTIDLPQHFVVSVLDGKIYRRNVNFRSNQDELIFLIILLQSPLGGAVHGMPILRKD